MAEDLNVDEWELYDRIKDPNEMKNVYDNPEYEKVVKKPSRKKRGFEMREAELRASEDKDNINNASETKDDDITVNNVSA